MQGIVVVRLVVILLSIDAVTAAYNIAFGKPVTGNFTLGRMQRAVDGLLDDANSETPSYTSTSCSQRAAITIDLGTTSQVTSVVIWHKFSDGRQYCGQKLAISSSGAFAGEETVVFDHGTGFGASESGSGITYAVASVKGRYVRHWVAKSSVSNTADIVEIKVYGTIEQAGATDLVARFPDSTTCLTAPSGVVGASSFTISLWVRVNRQTLGDRMNIFQQRNNTCSDGQYMIFITKDERLEVLGFQLAPTVVIFSLTSNGKDVVDGAWHHVALVQNAPAGTGSLYLDGSLVGSHSQGALSVRCLGPYIGLDRGFNKGGLNGYLNEVTLWNTQAFTASQIAQLYNKTSTPLTISATLPLFLYTFDEISSSGTTVYDSSSRNNHGSISSISGSEVFVPVVEARQIADFSMHGFDTVNDVDLQGVMKYMVNVGDGAYGSWTSNTSTSGYQIAVQFNDGRIQDKSMPTTFGDSALNNVLYSYAHAMPTGTFRITVTVQQGAFYKLQGLWMEWYGDSGYGIRVDGETVAYDFSAYDITGVSTTRAAAFQYSTWAKSNQIVLDLGGVVNLDGFLNPNASLSGFTLEFLGCSSSSYYAPQNSQSPCQPCGSNTATADPFATTCSCAPGYTFSQSSCTPCAANTYKGIAGNSACVACPSDATSPVGSTSITQCTCPTGVSAYLGLTSCPSATPSPTTSATKSSSVSATNSRSPTVSPSATRSQSTSPSISVSPAVLPSSTPSESATASRSQSISPSATKSSSWSATVSVSPSASKSGSISATASGSKSISQSATSSISPTATRSSSTTPSPSPSASYVPPADIPQTCWVGCEDNMRTHARSLKTEQEVDDLKLAVSELAASTNATTVQMQFDSMNELILEMQSQLQSQTALIQLQSSLLTQLNATAFEQTQEIADLTNLTSQLNATVSSCAC